MTPLRPFQAIIDKIVDFAEACENWLGPRFWSQHELFPYIQHRKLGEEIGENDTSEAVLSYFR